MLFMVVPGQIFFVLIIQILQAGHTSITPQFVAVYLLMSLIQVSRCCFFFDILTSLFDKMQCLMQSLWLNSLSGNDQATLYQGGKAISIHGVAVHVFY